MKNKIAICWLRRDLRLEDNAALYHALKSGWPVLPLFIYDRNILDELEDRADARVAFIHDTLQTIKTRLQDQGSDLLVKYDEPTAAWQEILEEWSVGAVYTNRDYENYAIQRDRSIAELLQEHDISLHTYKDHVIFEADEVEKKAGGVYTVFTPYSRTWKAKLATRMSRVVEEGQTKDISYYFKQYPTEQYFTAFAETEKELWYPALAEMDFKPTKIDIPAPTVKRGLVRTYDETRNFPAINGTSRLGVHFRFGTISIRQKARMAQRLNETFLNELIWRDFYAQILSAFPKVGTESFRAEYDAIEWRNNEDEFAAWCAGQTGYPIVDAGMRELNTTGYMHNRVRMIVASFLTKHLLIDWRWGERYFAAKLLDYDLASNNGGWQWAAGCGTDAAPYFRVFNPTSQMEKFDKDKKYVRRWVPEYGTPDYPDPIVDHKMARERCLAVYKAGIARGRGEAL